MKIVNLTPHEITIITSEGGKVVLPPSGVVARVGTSDVACESVIFDGIEISVKDVRYTDVEGLPDREAGTVFIVSRLVLDRVKNDRLDVFAPGELIRDPAGKPVGCRGLSR
jgi:hypothetical protein